MTYKPIDWRESHIGKVWISIKLNAVSLDQFKKKIELTAKKGNFSQREVINWLWESWNKDYKYTGEAREKYIYLKRCVKLNHLDKQKE